MNAQELTECYFKDHNNLYQVNKDMDYLMQEVTKLRREIEDLKIDLKMIQHMNRK